MSKKIPLLTNKKKDPIDYKYSESDSLIFNAFLNDLHQWSIDTSDTNDLNVNYENGILKISNLSDSSSILGVSAEHVDFSQNYEIQFTYRIDEFYKKWHYAFRFWWGYMDSPGIINSYISVPYSGSISLVQCKGGDHLNDERYDVRIRGFDNIHTVNLRRIDDRFDVFANNTFVKSFSGIEVAGNSFGFGVHNGFSISVLDFKVFSLN